MATSATDWAWVEWTACAMRGLSIEFRDTFSFVRNWDNHKRNNCKADGDRHFRIEYGLVAYACFATGEGLYYFPDVEHHGFLHLAYDDPHIVLPYRYTEQPRPDAIVHECVHFLQVAFPTKQRPHGQRQYPTVVPYIDLKPDHSNMLEYLSQTNELEAHWVQLAYLHETSSDRMASLDEKSLARVKAAFTNKREIASIPGRELAIDLLMLCKKQQVL